MTASSSSAAANSSGALSPRSESPKMTTTTTTISSSTTSPSISFVGSPCCQHGQSTFYKAFRYRPKSTTESTTAQVNDSGGGGKEESPFRVLMLGEFFYLRLPPHDDPCIGELQLLWEDRGKGGGEGQQPQQLSSTRLYFLPEQSPNGRQSNHGEVGVLLLFYFNFS